MRKTNQTALLLALVVTSGGCESAGRQTPMHGGEPYTSMHGGFTVRLPVGWTFFESPPDSVQATIHDVRVQRIIVKYSGLEEPLPWSHRVIAPDLAPTDLTTALTEDVRGDDTISEMKVLESGPATIGGTPGCRFIARFRNQELGYADMTKTCYAAVHDARLYVLVYDARTGPYYDQGLPAFEETVRSFEFGKH